MDVIVGFAILFEESNARLEMKEKKKHISTIIIIIIIIIINLDCNYKSKKKIRVFFNLFFIFL